MRRSDPFTGQMITVEDWKWFESGDITYPGGIIDQIRRGRLYGLSSGTKGCLKYALECTKTAASQITMASGFAIDNAGELIGFTSGQIVNFAGYPLGSYHIKIYYNEFAYDLRAHPETGVVSATKIMSETIILVDASTDPVAVNEILLARVSVDGSSVIILPVVDERIYSDICYVSTDDIDDGAVTEPKIGTGAVTEIKVGALAITEPKVGALAISRGKVQDEAINWEKIEHTNDADKIQTDNLGDGCVPSAKITNNTIINTDISATANISSSKINFANWLGRLSAANETYVLHVENAYMIDPFKWTNNIMTLSGHDCGFVPRLALGFVRMTGGVWQIPVFWDLTGIGAEKRHGVKIYDFTQTQVKIQRANDPALAMPTELYLWFIRLNAGDIDYSYS